MCVIFDFLENNTKPEPAPLPSNRRRLSERVEEDMAKSQGNQKTVQKTQILAQNPSQVSLPNNNTTTSSITPPSTPFKSVEQQERDEIDDFTYPDFKFISLMHRNLDFGEKVCKLFPYHFPYC